MRAHGVTGRRAVAAVLTVVLGMAGLVVLRGEPPGSPATDRAGDPRLGWRPASEGGRPVRPSDRMIAGNGVPATHPATGASNEARWESFPGLPDARTRHDELYRPARAWVSLLQETTGAFGSLHDDDSTG